jgi:PAS domain S-box-containing protein
MIDAAMERGSNFFEWTHKKFSGEEFFATVTLTRMIYRGQPLLQATVRDITERKRAEEELLFKTALLEAQSETTIDGILVVDTTGQVLLANRQFARMLSVTEEVIRTQDDKKLIEYALMQLKDPDAFLERINYLHAHETEKTRDEIEFKDGRVFDRYSSPLQDSTGKLHGRIWYFRDITDRKRAEEELAFKTALLEAEAEASIDGILVVDRTGHVLQVNERFAELWNLPEDIFNTNDDKTFLEHILGQVKDHGDFQERVNYLYAHEAERSQEEIELKDGTVFDRYSAPLQDATSKYYGRIWYFRDITERKRAEADLLRYAHDQEAAKHAQEENSAKLAHLVEELAHERDLLGTLMDNVPDAIYFKDSQSRFTRINASQARILGVADSRTALGKTDFDFFPMEDAQAYYAAEQKIIASGEPVIGALEQHSDASGKFQWFSNTEVPVKDAQGRVTGIVGVGRDVTEWKSTLDAFRESEERYRELFENASDIVYTTGLDARLTSLNRVGQQIFGYSAEEATHLDLQKLVAPKHWEIVERSREHLWAGHAVLPFEVEVTTKDGRQMMLEVKPRLIYKGGKPVGVQAIARDITGRDKAEMELRHAQKLESVGRLASGIAHEINTPIQFVGDNTRFLQDSFAGLQTLLSKYQELRDAVDSGAVSPELIAEVRDVEETSDCAYLLEEIPKALSQTLDGVTRVATIVRAMKEFAHPESKELAAADLNRALLSTLTVARNELKYVADVETEFGDLPLVICNIGDLNQVFLNLLVNAAHAIDESMKGSGQKGKIRVRTLSEGGTVLVTITDTGGGIPEAIRGRIFDPFFTTKEVGRGTGQGLAIARSVVVERHKGALTFESEMGKGTTFYIRLPIDPGECSKEAKVP